MAYNKRNLYTRIVEIQDIVLSKQKSYPTQKELFYTEIEPLYHISIRTFQNYLEIPAKAELEKIKKREAEKLKARKAQLQLTF